MKFLLTTFGISVVSALNLSAVIFYDISQITVDNGGGPVVLINEGSNPDYGSGDANLTHFTTGGTQYSTSGYLSAVRIDNTAVSGVSGLIQPGTHLVENDPKFGTTGAYYTGSSEPASYLSHGPRGLSLNTALNLTPDDNPVTIRVGINIFNTAAMSDGVPDFVFGDGANNQSVDRVRFLAQNQTDVIAEFTMTPTTDSFQGDWYRFGTRGVDRLTPNGTGFRENGTANGILTSGSDAANDQNLEGNLIAFSLESNDLTAFGQDLGTFEDAMAAIAYLEIKVPAVDGEEPKTDYAFFAVNENAIDSPNLVPEPSSYALLIGFAATLATGLRRTRRD